ncbi:hypothetical protein [Acetobacter malorum]|uniref:hypothetical protein n=1 Tax=Acetobacter malorum TaxID=178901 RepID=UPI0012E7594F|nr:hypothetical protein [Acetobacter malorum]
MQTAVREALLWPASDGCGVTRRNPAEGAPKVPWSVVDYELDFCHGYDADRRRFRNAHDAGFSVDFRRLKQAERKI